MVKLVMLVIISTWLWAKFRDPSIKPTLEPYNKTVLVLNNTVVTIHILKNYTFISDILRNFVTI